MGLGEGRGLHWVAHPLHHTKFPWFEIFVCLFPCFMFLFVCVCVFVCLVCLFLLLCISIILSEQVNDFAFSGIFEVEESHKELSICPRHRDDFGTRWLCNKKKMLLSIGLGSTWEVFSERWSRHDSATVSKALCFNIYTCSGGGHVSIHQNSILTATLIRDSIRIVEEKTTLIDKSKDTLCAKADRRNKHTTSNGQLYCTDVKLYKTFGRLGTEGV